MGLRVLFCHVCRVVVQPLKLFLRKYSAFKHHRVFGLFDFNALDADIQGDSDDQGGRNEEPQKHFLRDIGKTDRF